MPYKKSYRRPRRKISRRKVMRKKTVSKSIKRYVKRAIASQAENKYTVSRLTNQGIACTAASTPTAISLLPSLAVGASRSTRLSNQITIKNAYIRGYVNLLPHSAGNPVACPVAVKMWLMSSAQYNEIGAFSGTAAASAFFKGDTAPVSMSASVLDLISDVETENFRVYAQKTIYLGCTSATNNFPSTSVGALDNSKFSAPFYFNWRKHFKTLKYNDTSSASIPTNRNLWLVFQSVPLDGSTSTASCAEFHSVTTTIFEDM